MPERMSEGKIPADEPSGSPFDLFDSVRRDVAREERASREVQRVSEGEITLDELQGSLTPAPIRRRSHPHRHVEPVDEAGSGAVFMAFSATFLLLGFGLVFGTLSLLAAITRVLVG